MALSHDDFFALAIDPDEAPDRSLLEAIEEHRDTCAPCRELEADYVLIREIGPAIPLDLEPDSPEVDERVLAAARAAIADRRRPRTRPRPALLRAFAFAAGAVASLAAGIVIGQSDLASDRLPRRTPSRDDTRIALFLEKNGYHDQATVLAADALTRGGLAPLDEAALRAIVAK